jgi:GDPmannose 4,6-dehydratase
MAHYLRRLGKSIGGHAASVSALIGDASKAAQKLGWTPKIGLEEIIQEMVASDIHRAKAVPLSLKA